MEVDSGWVFFEESSSHNNAEMVGFAESAEKALELHYR